MSHASGTVTFPDGEIYHFEYDGTSDITLPELYSSGEELEENWRKKLNWDDINQRRNRGEKSSEDVVLFSSYGGGVTYKGRASKCEKIVLWDEITYDTVNGWL